MSDRALLWIHEEPCRQKPEDLVDYKSMCFGGDPLCAFACTGRAEDDLRVDFFDSDWNHMPFARHYANAEVPPPCPKAAA